MFTTVFLLFVCCYPGTVQSLSFYSLVNVLFNKKNLRSDTFFGITFDPWTKK